MANFPLPSQLQTQYLQILQSIKPSININDLNSDFVIRGNVFAAFASGLYGDQAKTYNDTFISSSSPQGLTLHGQDLAIPQLQATNATSTGVTISGTNGTTVSPGDLTFLYNSTGITYTNTTGGTISSGTLVVSVQSTTPGAITNIAAPATLTLIAPPNGINISASLTVSLAGGSDLESTDSYRSRLLSRLQMPPAGGNATDIRNFAFDGDPSVRSVIVIPFALGLGTVGVYILTGSTDIDTAVTQGQSIVRIPSQSVINNVQTYMNNHAPLTMCVSVYAPTEIPFSGTVYVDLAAGITLSTIPNSPTYNPLGLTVSQLIMREYGRALYKVPVGGWMLGSASPPGYIVASYIEQSMQQWLSAEVDPVSGLTIGNIPILADIRVPAIGVPSGTNYAITSNQIVAPGTINVVLGT